MIYSRKFAKGLKAIIKSGKPEMRDRVKQVSSHLKEDPHMKRPNVDIKLISSREESVYRVRIGNHRMTYEVDEEKKLIMVTKIFPRGKGY
ncbi:MAG: type II toxin-antitoxin system RelE/ParE family toxin [Candidatus Thermoplasmatota archaeon]|nr:type II toxin-antitoxin system RelE/ParE family toxin [Candidatus Thermoplasmatota archaeon]